MGEAAPVSSSSVPGDDLEATMVEEAAAPVSSRPADPLEDLEALALRVVGLEAEAVAAHALAQRLNKEGSFAGTSMMSDQGGGHMPLCTAFLPRPSPTPTLPSHPEDAQAAYVTMHCFPPPSHHPPLSP